MLFFQMENVIVKFECILKKYEDKNAVTYLDEKAGDFENLTYKSVKHIFETCCQNISKNITEEHCCVALLMEHNAYIPSLVMSLQKLGHCFLFLNEYDTKDAHLKLLKQLNIKWLISADKQNNNFLLKEYCFASEIVPAFNLWKIKLNEHCLKNYENISYVTCTSGTTGANKIVKVQNYCIYANVRSIQSVLEITSEDVIYFGTSLTFDPSMIELFLALITGASLLILPRKIHANPRSLFKQLFPHNQKRVSFLQIPPSVFLRFTTEEIQYIFQESCLKTLCLGGENFPNEILYIPRKTDLRIFNLYGITEVSCWASAFELKHATEIVCLGTALADTFLEVRDENGQCIPEGVGEMFIGSSTRICVIDNEILPNDQNTMVFRATGDIVRVHNNTYVYVGRKNDMIKRYGNRIVLSHIENTVFEKTHLLNKCVWCEQECKLLLFFIIQNFEFSQKERIIDKLRVKLLHLLPKENFPDFIDVLKSIPLTYSGKLDKNALYELFLSSKMTQPNLNGLKVFNELLLRYFGVSQIKSDATLLEMGANSILLLQFFEDLKSHYSNEINNEFLTLLFEKNIEDCRKYISSIKLTKAKKRKQFVENDFTKPDKNSSSNDVVWKVIWKYGMKGCVDCSPILINRSKKPQQLIAIGSFAHIFAIIDTSGSKLAEIVLPDTIEAACSVSTCNNFVYVGSFDCTMYCIQIDDGSIIWKFITGDRLKSTPVLCKNSKAIVFGSYDKHLYCLNTLDGSLIWKSNLNGIINTKPISAKENIFVATIVGTCFCIAESDGSVLWKYSTGHPLMGSPCFIEFEENTYVCWPNVNGTLNCFSCSDWKLMWKYQTSNQVFSSLLYYSGFVIFGCQDHFLYCLQLEKSSASLKFKTCLDSPISSASCILEQKFIVTPTTAGSIFLISLESGEIQTQINLGAQIFSSPCVCDNRIYIGCRDNNLYCLEINKLK